MADSMGTVPVTLWVEGEKVRAGATKSGRMWTVVAALFPEFPVSDPSFERAKAELVRKLGPEVRRLQEQSARG